MFRKISIKTRLMFSFLIITCLMVGVGGVAILTMKEIRSNLTAIESNYLPSVRHLGVMSTNLTLIRLYTLRLLVETDNKAMQSISKTIDETKKSSKESDTYYQTLITEDREKALYASYKKAEEIYYRLQVKVVEFSLRNNNVDAKKLMEEMNQAANQVNDLQQELIKLNREYADKASLIAGSQYTQSFISIVTIILVSASFALIIAFVISKSINFPLRRAVKTAQTIAQGDLTEHIVTEGDDEITELSSALIDMQESLKNAIIHIGDSSSQLASAAEELSSVTEGSTKDLTLQNNEIQLAAAAISEMSSAINEVARRAQKASEDSAYSASLAEQGKKKVDQTTTVIIEMNEGMIVSTRVINQLAEQVASISQILDVIRAVAEQTNLLALNAAIEAARAGESGRGFAVVADEVRNLAHRTQESTGEIETMVRQVQLSANEAVSSMETTSQKTTQAQLVADEATKVFEQITARIVSISDSNLMIASAAEQQSNVAKDIDGNITKISDLAAQTVVGANQTTASTAELTRLAIELNELVVKFKV